MKDEDLFINQSTVLHSHMRPPIEFMNGKTSFGCKMQCSPPPGRKTYPLLPLFGQYGTGKGNSLNGCSPLCSSQGIYCRTL